MGIRETEFQIYLPQFNDADAAKFFSEHGEIVSVNCHQGANDTLAVAFATRAPEVFGPFALNKLVAEALLRRLLVFVENPPT